MMKELPKLSKKNRGKKGEADFGEKREREPQVMLVAENEKKQKKERGTRGGRERATMGCWKKKRNRESRGERGAATPEEREAAKVAVERLKKERIEEKKRGRRREGGSL